MASLKYKATATHGAGVTAKDNLGSDSNPAVAIAAGTKSKETAAYTPFRNYFYGATAEKPTLNSDYIRSLTKSGKAYAAGTLTINVPVGAQRVAIACIATAKGVTKVINETAMNADVTSTFTKSTVSVEGREWLFGEGLQHLDPLSLLVPMAMPQSSRLRWAERGGTEHGCEQYRKGILQHGVPPEHETSGCFCS